MNREQRRAREKYKPLPLLPSDWEASWLSQHPQQKEEPDSHKNTHHEGPNDGPVLQASHVGVLLTTLQNVSAFGGRVYAEVTKLK